VTAHERFNSDWRRDRNFAAAVAKSTTTRGLVRCLPGLASGCGRDTLDKPPLALNLYYALTPFAEDQIDEHRVLGEAMRILYDHAIIAAPLLQGDLEQSAEEFKIDLCAFTLEELTRIWYAVNRPYRLSISYEVRIVLIDSNTERPSQRVTEKENRYVQLHRR
jgi:hypothetical protein